MCTWGGYNKMGNEKQARKMLMVNQAHTVCRLGIQFKRFTNRLKHTGLCGCSHISYALHGCDHKCKQTRQHCRRIEPYWKSVCPKKCHPFCTWNLLTCHISAHAHTYILSVSRALMLGWIGATFSSDKCAAYRWQYNWRNPTNFRTKLGFLLRSLWSNPSSLIWKLAFTNLKQALDLAKLWMLLDVSNGLNLSHNICPSISEIIISRLLHILNMIP